MISSTLNRFQIASLMKSKMIILSLLICSSSAYAQGNLTQYKPSPTSSNEVLKIINTPQNQNDVELIMFVLKTIEDKNIKETTKKINFVDTFKISDDIKKHVKSLIRQGLNYSDHEKDSYGIYALKGCKDRSISTSSLNRGSNQ